MVRNKKICALWFLLTGGEPFIRPDFVEIYRYAAQKGLLVTIFTNGTLLTPQLADELAVRARAAGLRAPAVETQNTNVAAIRFYRSVGFAIEGIDLSYYSNIDVEDGEVAIFLKRKLP